MEQKNLYRVKLHLEASTPQELTKKMLANNQKYNMEFDYTDFMKPNSSWVCWYYAPIDRLLELDRSKSVEPKPIKKVSRKK